DKPLARGVEPKPLLALDERQKLGLVGRLHLEPRAGRRLQKGRRGLVAHAAVRLKQVRLEGGAAVDIVVRTRGQPRRCRGHLPPEQRGKLPPVADMDHGTQGSVSRPSEGKFLERRRRALGTLAADGSAGKPKLVTSFGFAAP